MATQTALTTATGAMASVAAPHHSRRSVSRPSRTPIHSSAAPSVPPSVAAVLRTSAVASPRPPSASATSRTSRRPSCAPSICSASSVSSAATTSSCVVADLHRNHRHPPKPLAAPILAIQNKSPLVSQPTFVKQQPTLSANADELVSTHSSQIASTPPQTPSTASAYAPSTHSHDRALRKIMDLEIANASLLAVNSSLEQTVRQQSIAIRNLKKQLARFCHQSGSDTDTLDQIDIAECDLETASDLLGPENMLSETETQQNASIKSGMVDRLCRLVQNLVTECERAVKISAAPIPDSSQDVIDSDTDVCAGSGMFFHLPVSHNSIDYSNRHKNTFPQPSLSAAPSDEPTYLDDIYTTHKNTNPSTPSSNSDASAHHPPHDLFDMVQPKTVMDIHHVSISSSASCITSSGLTTCSVDSQSMCG